MALKYPPFAACKALENAARNAPPLKLGSRGPAVALLQSALLQLKESLPHSLKPGGIPDGIFGPDTLQALKAYQTKAKLNPDGVAGSTTILKLDGEMMKLSSPPVPPPTPLAATPATPHYEVGTGDPTLRHDPGAGPWRSKPTQYAYMALKQSIIDALPVAMAVIGMDAVKHMAHYLGNSGKNHTIDLEGMVREVPSARKAYEDEVAQAQGLVEQLSPGTHKIHSKMAESRYNRQKENTNWFFAIGGYSKWGQGTATVRDTPGGREYELDFEYRFYDRYNWDAGKSVTFAGITVTDKFMGEFHRQGLAQEYDCHGSFKRRFTWKKGGSIPAQQLDGGGGR